MRHEHEGCWARPFGPLAIGETCIAIEGNEMIVRVKCPGPIELAEWKTGRAIVDIHFDDEMWD